MTVYVDILLAVNIFVNYFLLLASEKILKTNVKRKRLFFGASVGSLYSLIIFLPKMPEILTVLINFSASAIIVVITFLPRKIKAFFKEVAIFFLVNFAFAGIMLGFWLAFRPNGMVFNNSIVYFNIDIKILTVSTVICYLVLNLISRFMKRSAPKDRIFSVTFTNAHKSVTVNALLDTGNTLKDGFSGKPVIIANKNVFIKLIGFSPEDCFRGNNALDMRASENNIRLIPYNTVGETGFLKAITVDNVRVNSQNISINNALVAQAKHDFSNGEYSAILNNDFFERTDYNDKRIHNLTFAKD